MQIKQKLTWSYVGIAILVGVVGYFNISLSKQIEGLRYIELPMEQNLREVEVGIWEVIHTAYSFRLSRNKFYKKLYNKEIINVEGFLAKYADLTDTKEEKQFLAEFSLLWEEAKAAGSKMIELTNKQKSAEDVFFISVDEADDVIDFEIQGKWRSTDPDILQKEQAVREVEVSIWEAIHAGQQFTGLAGNIVRGNQKYIGNAREAAKRGAKASLVKGDFADLMEAQFQDVEEYWAKYKALTLENFEVDAIKAFEGYWSKAVEEGRKVVSLQNQIEDQFNILFDKIDKADDVIDFKIQGFIQKRIALEDRKAKYARNTTIALSIFSLISAIVVGFFTSRSVCRPLIELMNAATEVGRGNLGTKVESKSKDEIGKLSVSFNNMSSDLEKTIDNLNQEISERKKAEKSLQRLNEKLEDEIEFRKDVELKLQNSNKKLKYTNQQLEEFIFAASHDLREPLRKILAFSFMLTRNLKGKLTSDQKENFNFMAEGADRMREIVEALLNYSRLINQDFKLHEVDLNNIINDIKDYRLNKKIKQAGGEIYVPELLPVITCDGRQIEEVLYHLIDNGLKYHRKNVTPEITIRAEKLDDRMIRIEVEDNGIGIKPEHFQTIFAMFRRLHTKDQYEGTGTGLAVCKRIVEEHQGEIGVNSTFGKGTIFWFTLPFRQNVDSKQSSKIMSGDI